jgi:uncharacterized membrane protein
MRASKSCGQRRSSRAMLNRPMERRLFWLIVIVLGLIADFVLPFWWALAATIPIFAVSWWIVYRSDWF